MEIQKQNTDKETLDLIDAVLERLTFHAFEEVLIWSNEHASRALTLCLKKTLKEFESGELILTSSYPKLKHFSVDSAVKALSTALDQAQDHQCNLNKEIDRLENQLSKAQAVPEGFVLVETSELESLKSDNEHFTKSCIDWTDRAYKQRAKVDNIKNEVERFKQSGTSSDLGRFLDNLIEFSTFKCDAEFEGFVLVPVKEIKTWYLDDSENIYREDPDWLCDIAIGEVVEVEHRVSYELDQDPVFATIQWDEKSGDVGYYKTFKSKDEAEKVAAHCKAMNEAQEQSHD